MADSKSTPVVYLLVRGTAVNDSRLAQQASTLASNGFRVIVLASQALDLPYYEERDGYVIKRFPYPPHYRFLRFYNRLPLYTRRLWARLVRRYKITRNTLRRRFRIIRNQVWGFLRRRWRTVQRGHRRALRLSRRVLRLPRRALRKARKTLLGPPAGGGEEARPEFASMPGEAAAGADVAGPPASSPPREEPAASAMEPPESIPGEAAAETRPSLWERLGALILAFHALTVKVLRAPIIWWPLDRPFRMLHFGWHCFWLARKEPGQVFQGRRLESLPVAFLLSRLHKAKLVYDCSDLALVAAETVHIKGWRRWLLRKYEGYLSRRSDAILVVSEPMVQYMVDHYQVKPPVVISNFPYRVESLPGRSHLHDALELPESARLILYLGGIRRGRAIDELIESISFVDEGYLVFMGYGAREGTKRAARNFGVEDRVLFLPPVPPAEVIAWASGAHVGVHPMRPSCFNHVIALPNKIFQYLMAGLPAVVSRGTEMAKLVDAHRTGAVCDPEDSRDMARAIEAVLGAPDYADMRRRSREVAVDLYCWERQEKTLADLYRAIVNEGHLSPERKGDLTASRL